MRVKETLLKLSKFKSFNKNQVILFSLLLLLSLIFFIFISINSQKVKQNQNNLETIVKTNEFSNLTNFLFSKIKSPYE